MAVKIPADMSVSKQSKEEGGKNRRCGHCVSIGALFIEKESGKIKFFFPASIVEEASRWALREPSHLPRSLREDIREKGFLTKLLIH